MLASLNESDILVIILITTLLVGAILFLLTGIMVIKKDHEAVIERLGVFKGVYKAGVYYRPTFTYRRVGIYSLIPQRRTLHVGSTIIEITFKIVDVKTYHYSGHNIGKIFSKLEESPWDNPKDYIQALQSELENIGCALLKKGEW